MIPVGGPGQKKPPFIKEKIRPMTEIIHEIVNDFAVDSIKDNFSPPKITEMREDVAEHLIEKLGLSFQLFFEDIKKNGEYLKDNGKVFFWTSDVAKFIRKELFGNSE